jgi:hypothetical protein
MNTATDVTQVRADAQHGAAAACASAVPAERVRCDGGALVQRGHVFAMVARPGLGSGALGDRRLLVDGHCRLGRRHRAVLAHRLPVGTALRWSSQSGDHHRVLGSRRVLASGCRIHSGVMGDLWCYFTAPVVGALLATTVRSMSHRAPVLTCQLCGDLGLPAQASAGASASGL